MEKLLFGGEAVVWWRSEYLVVERLSGCGGGSGGGVFDDGDFVVGEAEEFVDGAISAQRGRLRLLCAIRQNA